ncbi:VWA domain-containing protein [Methanoculleus sp. YWC-01]|uniref:VWA domain-containing protein n=1 Tax=Methanoculleus nereidis TaxID=2735141 RepID=A0ABU3Z0I0_9EURY|nr:VWA domain-containing protein [Methanoculleus sp. YWC-01]MDV4342317.1 VWA domain-containing protein [Methanoculleus sp. YWC-01]
MDVKVEAANSSGPIYGIVIDFAVDSVYGSISPVRVVTNDDGKATATFRHGTRSGTATITATMSHEELDEPLTDNVEQQIDHAAPNKIANLWYEPEVTAGETTEIVVQVADRYGNLVDGRRESAEGSDPEEVFFMVGSPTENATFIGATKPDEIEMPVNTAGDAIATLRVDTVAGENLVWIQPALIGFSGSRSISITGLGGLPADITQAVAPDSGSVPADGKTKVSFTYTLLDEFGNPSAGQGLWVNATLKRLSQPDEQESRLLNTNAHGQVMITYGPEDSVGMAIITATAAANVDVSTTQELEFTSTDPTNMLLSASPQSMPSRDVKSDSVSQIRAKVMDVRGNPVGDETVWFEILSVNFDGYNQTEGPCIGEGLNTTSAITNDNGYALVEFSPGSFAREGESGWSETATGTAIVRATWGNVSRDIELTWKNYPYLSVETEVSPETVAVNDTVDVTIRLRGDGWALQPDPIDVVLVIDRSGSMKYDIARNSGTSNERMEAAQDAANNFVAQMNSTRDRVALVSFAFDATLDQGLTSDSNEIEGSINSLSADGATNMRMAYYTAIKYLKENGRSNAVKAVILMGDGDWNYHGSPLAKGTGYADNNRYLTSDWYSYPYWAPLSGYPWSGSSYSFSNERYEWYHDLPDPKGDASGTQKLDTGYWYDTWNYNEKEYRTPTNNICDNGQFTNQNMSVYANSGDETGNVTIYSIGFASVLDSDVEEDLGVLSEATGGEYVWAGNEDELREVYTKIAGELKTEAGVDTKLDVVFKQVEVNGNLTSGSGVFDYIYEEDVSTTVESWVDNETGHYEVINFTTIEQTDDWDDQNLHFDIGTVRLGQTWETTFRLAVKTEGNINIFGPGSTISFNNGTDSLELPDTFITAYPLNNTGMDFAVLNISNLNFTGTEPIDEFFPVTWDLNYTGLYGVTEDVFYSNDNEYTWVKFDTLSATNETTSGESTLDVRGLPPGEYIIRVRGYAPDTEDASAKITRTVTAGATGSAYIRIQ